MAIARVTNNKWLTAQANDLSVAKAFADNVQAGSLLVAFYAVGNATAPDTATFSDNQGNTWVEPANTDYYYSTLGHRIQIAYAANAAAGATTVTVTGGGEYRDRFLAICEYTGCATVSPVDGTPVNSNSGSVTSTVSPGQITSTGDALFIAACQFFPASITPGASYTEQYDGQPAGGAHNEYAIQDWIATGAQTNETLAWSASTQKQYWAAVGIAFKASAGASVVKPLGMLMGIGK